MKTLLNRWHRTVAIAVSLLVVAVAPAWLGAQDAGAPVLAGTVLDVAGKAIPNAAVSVKNESTGALRQVVTGTDGQFSVTGLPAGLYTIEVSAPSFASSRRAGVRLAAGTTEKVTMSLNVGEL